CLTSDFHNGARLAGSGEALNEEHIWHLQRPSNDVALRAVKFAVERLNRLDKRKRAQRRARICPKIAKETLKAIDNLTCRQFAGLDTPLGPEAHDAFSFRIGQNGKVPITEAHGLRISVVGRARTAARQFDWPRSGDGSVGNLRISLVHFATSAA